MLLITILYVACHDSVRPEDYVKATKDVVSWSAKATAVFEPVFGDSLITVLGKVYSNEGFIREELAFLKFHPGQPATRFLSEAHLIHIRALE